MTATKKKFLLDTMLAVLDGVDGDQINELLRSNELFDDLAPISRD